MDDLPVCDINDSINMIHFNIRSLPAHYEEFEALIDILNNPVILGFAEKWLKPVNESLCTLPGYKAYDQSREKMGSGVAIYVKENIVSSPRPDLSNVILGLAESIFIEVKLSSNSRPVIIGEIFHPPRKSSTQFIENLN